MNVNILEFFSVVHPASSINELQTYFKNDKDPWTITDIQGGRAASLRLHLDCLSGSEVLILGMEAEQGRVCSLATREDEVGFGQFFLLIWASPGTFVTKGRLPSQEFNRLGDIIFHPPGSMNDLSVGNLNGNAAFAAFLSFRAVPKQNRPN